MTRVVVSMPEEFLENIDKVAESENRTRSELIREALRRYMRTTTNSINSQQNTKLLEDLL